MRKLYSVVLGLLPFTTWHIAHADEATPVKRVAAATEELPPPVTLTAAPAEPIAPRYPRAIIDRPATYPAGMATAGFDVGAAARGLDDSQLRVLAGVGLTDRVEANFGHSSFTPDHLGRGAFDFGLGAHVGQTLDGQLDLGLKVESGYSLDDHQLEPLYVGVTGQYILTPKLALLTPGNQLAFGMAAEQPGLTLNLPIALGYQASSLVFFQLDTSLASFDVGGSSASWMFADTTPLALTAFVNVMPAIDVFAGVSLDLTPPDAPDEQDDAKPAMQITDTLGVLVGARYYFGRR